MDDLTINGWTVHAEMHGELLLVQISCPDEKKFCNESVKAHMQPDKVSFMLGASENENHECALPVVEHTCDAHPVS